MSLIDAVGENLLKLMSKVNSVQEAALRFTYQNLKSCKSLKKNETKNIGPLVFSFSLIDLAFCLFFDVV